MNIEIISFKDLIFKSNFSNLTQVFCKLSLHNLKMKIDIEAGSLSATLERSALEILPPANALLLCSLILILDHALLFKLHMVFGSNILPAPMQLKPGAFCV